MFPMSTSANSEAELISSFLAHSLLDQMAPDEQVSAPAPTPRSTSTAPELMIEKVTQLSSAPASTSAMFDSSFYGNSYTRDDLSMLSALDVPIIAGDDGFYYVSIESHGLGYSSGSGSTSTSTTVNPRNLSSRGSYASLSSTNADCVDTEDEDGGDGRQVNNDAYIYTPATPSSYHWRTNDEIITSIASWVKRTEALEKKRKKKVAEQLAEAKRLELERARVQRELAEAQLRRKKEEEEEQKKKRLMELQLQQAKQLQQQLQLKLQQQLQLEKEALEKKAALEAKLKIEKSIAKLPAVIVPPALKSTSRSRSTSSLQMSAASSTAATRPAIKRRRSESSLVKLSARSSSNNPTSKSSGIVKPTAAPRRQRSTKRRHTYAAEEANKPFKCKTCFKPFRRQEHVKRHERSLHTNERPYPCEHCDRKFSRSDNLAQHVKTHHL